MRKAKLLFMGMVIFLVACSSSEVTLVTNNGDKVSLEEVSQQLNEWQIKQEKLENLSVLESDLQMLIKAISVNNQLSALPQSLQSEKDTVIYGALEDEDTNENSIGDDISEEQMLKGDIFVTIGSYVSSARATQQKDKLITQLPNFLSTLQIDTQARQQQNITLYDLQVYGFNTVEQAKAFCYVLIQKGGICKLT